jgi:tetratricopeptide (TPR) repeat protein
VNPTDDCEPHPIEEARRQSLIGDYSGALNLINQYLNDNPENTSALLLKGNILELAVYAEVDDEELSYEDCHRLAEAKLCYELIIQKNPTHLDALMDLGKLYSDAKKYEESLFFLHKALKQLESNDITDSGKAIEVRVEIFEIDKKLKIIQRSKTS